MRPGHQGNHNRLTNYQIIFSKFVHNACVNFLFVFCRFLLSHSTLKSHIQKLLNKMNTSTTKPYTKTPRLIFMMFVFCRFLLSHSTLKSHIQKLLNKMNTSTTNPYTNTQIDIYIIFNKLRHTHTNYEKWIFIQQLYLSLPPYCDYD